VPVLEDLRNSTDQISIVGRHLMNGAFSEDRLGDYENFTQTISDIFLKTDAFGEVDETLSGIYKSDGRDQCYYTFL
jgi:hypothetical protein